MKKTSLSISTLPRCHIIDPNGNPNRPLMPSSSATSRLSESLLISPVITHSSHKSLNNPCCGLLKAHRPAPRGLLSLTALIASTLALSTLLTPMAYAALSATTANTIEGSKPYFELNGTGLNSTAELLGFSYKDVTNTVKQATAAEAVAGTNIIVHPTMKTNELLALVPITNTNTTLHTVLHTAGTPLAVVDTDGDASLLANTSANGALTANLKKDGTVITLGNDTFDPCSSYELEIAIDISGGATGTLDAKTTFGDPNIRQYAYPATVGTPPQTITSATYVIMPKVTTLKTCWAIPASGASYNATYPVNATHFDATNKGFLPQTAPNPNFPTTGSNGLFFDLVFAGAKASDITVTRSGGTQSNLALTTPYGGNANKVKLQLTGPKHGDATAVYTPSTFTIKDSVTGTTLYTFTLNQWFIARPSEVTGYETTPGSGIYFWGLPGGYDGTGIGAPAGSEYATHYCGTTLPGYKVPSALDYTNAFTAAQIGPGGSKGGNYTRAIGGGLFAEWGMTHGYNINGTDLSPIVPASGPYPASDWERYYYWASEPWSATNQYGVGSYYGYVLYSSPSYTSLRAACVSP